jgi:histidinol-phosphate aminotransferase
MPILAPSPLLPPVAAYIRDCATYQPGKPIEEVQRELGLADIIKLASNENPLGPSPKALQAIQEELPRLQLYPDASHFRLREALAGRFGTDLEEVMVGNGSEEIFSLLIRSYCAPGDNTVSCGAAFLAYRVCSQVHGAEYREPPLSRNAEAEIDEMLKLVDQRTRIVFLPNPNNPTGTYINRALLKKTLDALKGRELVVLLDYAYREYASAPDLPGPMEFYRDYPNLIVTGTFSKIYGLGGLRVGYGLRPSGAAPAVAQGEDAVQRDEPRAGRGACGAGGRRPPAPLGGGRTPRAWHTLEGEFRAAGPGLLAEPGELPSGAKVAREPDENLRRLS